MTVNNLYTFILDFRGGTYISQIVATSPKQALVGWSKSLKIEDIEGLGQAGKERIIEEALQEDPVLIQGMTTVWCSSFSSAKSLAIVHYVQTAS